MNKGRFGVMNADYLFPHSKASSEGASSVNLGVSPSLPPACCVIWVKTLEFSEPFFLFVEMELILPN